MKIKKCPYCGKRISYLSIYSSRRKGEYVCERCGKESKVIVDKKVIMVFAITLVIALGIMCAWIFAGFVSNPLGIIAVAVPLIIFSFITPKFVDYEPLKKYKKSMEAKKAGIEYSDNLITSELDNNDMFSSTSFSSDNTDNSIQINTEIFNKIKAERNAEREKIMGNDIISDSASINNQDYVPIINNVSENHMSTQAPLKKIHSESTPVRRNHHFIPQEQEINSSEQKKSESNRFSSNRKF